MPQNSIPQGRPYGQPPAAPTPLRGAARLDWASCTDPKCTDPKCTCAVRSVQR